jgi:hypothetical protein
VVDVRKSMCSDAKTFKQAAAARDRATSPRRVIISHGENITK